jgi:large subunit ribosomal protein L9
MGSDTIGELRTMAQKILLLEDVESVGRKGEVAAVKPGYAFNYLIPQGFALVANRTALRRQTKLQEERRVRAEAERKESLELASRLEGETVEIEVKVDHEGHLYGGVSVLDVIKHVKLKTGIDLEKKMILLKQHLKEVGIFDLTVRFKEDVTAQIHVKIFPKEEEQ